MVVFWLPCILSHFSRVQLLATPWTVAHQAPLSMGFSRQEYWSGLPFPSPGDLSDPGIESTSHYVSCTGRRVLYSWATWDTQASSPLVKKTVLNPALCSPLERLSYRLLRLLRPSYLEGQTLYICWMSLEATSGLWVRAGFPPESVPSFLLSWG